MTYNDKHVVNNPEIYLSKMLFLSFAHSNVEINLTNFQRSVLFTSVNRGRSCANLKINFGLKILGFSRVLVTSFENCQELYRISGQNSSFFVSTIIWFVSLPRVINLIRGLFKKYADYLHCAARVGFRRIRLVSLDSYRSAN